MGQLKIEHLYNKFLPYGMCQEMTSVQLSFAQNDLRQRMTRADSIFYGMTRVQL